MKIEIQNSSNNKNPNNSAQTKFNEHNNFKLRMLTCIKSYLSHINIENVNGYEQGSTVYKFDNIFQELDSKFLVPLFDLYIKVKHIIQTKHFVYTEHTSNSTLD